MAEDNPTVHIIPADPAHRDDLAGRVDVAAAVGATPALPEVRRRLDLDTVDSAVWSAMLADARQRAGGYTTRSWVGEVPDDLVDEVARLEGRMNVDAPIGDLQLEQEHYD